MENFNFAPTPNILFGNGKINELPKILLNYKNVLLITGKKSFKNSKQYENLLNNISNNIYIVSIDEEPTLNFIDKIVLNNKKNNIDVVVAIGGGSVLDAGKAISAMITVEDSVINYIEGIGNRKHPGTKIPFIAVPTTSGTGSEMTKNAVIKNNLPNGFKKSLRHDNFIPNIAIIDPQLTLTCNKNITIFCGLDTLTHLIESYLSTNSSIFTDELAIHGIKYFNEGFIKSILNGDLNSREYMSYASMIGGITLANSGLGIVHGFASSIGGISDIAHGIICSRLLPPCTKMTINRLMEDKKSNMNYLNKYRVIGEILSNKKTYSVEEGCDALINMLYEYIEEFEVPILLDFNINKENLENVIKNTSNKNNPISLSYNDLYEILLEVI